MAQISQLRDIYADDHADADKEKQKWDAFAAAEAICSIVESEATAFRLSMSTNPSNIGAFPHVDARAHKQPIETHK